MAILVDYTCSACGTRAEHWTPSPPPTQVACAGCGGASRRAWAAIGLSGSSAGAPSDGQPAPGTPRPPRRSMCADYPMVPGLCHMSESAGRMWVAKYLKDGRAIDREQERQEKAAAAAPPTMADAITHHHHNHQPTAPAS
jgi:hypothetical protein